MCSDVCLTSIYNFILYLVLYRLHDVSKTHIWPPGYRKTSTSKSHDCKVQVLKARGYMTPGILEEGINNHEEESLSTIYLSPTTEAEIEACKEEYSHC